MSKSALEIAVWLLSDANVHRVESLDPEFEDYARRFSSIETATEKLLKDTKAYNEAASNMFTHGAGFANHFAAVFHPQPGEYDLAGKHPDSAHTIRHVDDYEVALEELKSAIVPELELIESRIIGPVKELQGVLKTIRKTITKREHKVRCPPEVPVLSEQISARGLRPVQQFTH